MAKPPEDPSDGQDQDSDADRLVPEQQNTAELGEPRVGGFLANCSANKAQRNRCHDQNSDGPVEEVRDASICSAEVIDLHRARPPSGQ
jgi:hypothetical protein